MVRAPEKCPSLSLCMSLSLAVGFLLGSSHGITIWRLPSPRSSVPYTPFYYQCVPYATRQRALVSPGVRSQDQLYEKMEVAAAVKEKVFVALPTKFKVGKSTLSWALRHFGGTGATIVITHVHVPPRMIPILVEWLFGDSCHENFLDDGQHELMDRVGAKFHASKLSPEQVKSFRRIEREKLNELLDEYIHECFKMEVKFEKLVFEKEDVVAGLLELIFFHGVTKLVISAGTDRQYSRKMDKPKSRKAMDIMQRADPSCKIWFVCKGQLICTRDMEAETAGAVTPLLPDSDHQILQLSPRQEEDEVESELGFYDELNEACIAAENLMNVALNESSQLQKAEEEVVSAIQKAKEYQELYLEEVKRHKYLEGALVRANREIARLRQANHLPDNQQIRTMDGPQEAMSEKLILEQCTPDMNSAVGTAGRPIEAQKVYARIQLDHDYAARELQALQSKLTLFSPSSVIHSGFDEDCIPSYFFCPIFQEVMRDPHIAADGFTYEANAIRGWLDGGHIVSPVTNQPLAHHELIPNFALKSVIQHYMIRQQYRFSRC
ncbi:hypothetical protein ACP4OV_004035 [Aristida adscensionis]